MAGDSPAVSAEGGDQPHDAEGTGPESVGQLPRRGARTEVVEFPGDGEVASKDDRAATRKELIQTAFEKVVELLQTDGNVSQATINSLVQLLKLERELIEQEPPHEIRVVWQETDGEFSSDG